MFDALTKELGIILGLFVFGTVAALWWLITSTVEMRSVLSVRGAQLAEQIKALEVVDETYDERLDAVESPQELSDEQQAFRDTVERRFREAEERETEQFNRAFSRIFRLESWQVIRIRDRPAATAIDAPPVEQDKESP